MRAQGALEYLIIIAAVLGISAVVVLFVGGAFIGSSGGADLSKCRLAAANCQKDMATGLSITCPYCDTACKDASGKDLLDGKTDCGLACQQCKKGITIGAGAGTSIGAVGYWGMEEGRSITISDGSGNNNIGTYYGETFNDGTLINGPGWTSGTQGGAVSLDGLNDYVGVTSVPSLKYKGGDMTIGIWINADTAETQNGWIVSKPWNGNGIYNYALKFMADESINFTLMGATVYSIYTPASAVPRGSWHYITATVNSSKDMRIYIDGVERASGTHNIASWTPGYPGDSNVDLAIGTLYPYPYGSGWSGRSDFSFDGMIDSARIWMNKALNQTEILEERASSRPVIRPFADWEFEENNGLFANDTHIWVAGRKGVALSFDGVDDYIRIPNSPSLNINKNITISAWVYPTGPHQDSYGGILYNISGAAHSRFLLRSDGLPTAQVTPYSPTLYGPLATNNAWNNLVYMFNGTHEVIYTNGVKGTEQTKPGQSSGVFAYTIGWGYNLPNFYHFNGIIDEVRVFNRTLTETEIRGL